MCSTWRLAAALLCLAAPHTAAQDEISPTEINLASLTCDKLRDNTEQLDGCRFSVVNEKEQQVSCKMLVKHKTTDGIVTEYKKTMLNTLSFRLMGNSPSDEKGEYCASLASMYLQIWSKELKENHTVGDLPVAFISFLSFFTEDSFSRINFTKQIPVAKIYLKNACHGLPRTDLHDDCIEKVMFLTEVKRGAFHLQFTSDDFWRLMKRRFVEDLGAEMTHLSIASSGLLFSVPVHFLAQLMTSDLRMKELTLANVQLGGLQGPLITMPTLRVLRLPDNHITKVSEATLQAVPGLLELDLEGNQLDELPAWLPGGLVALNVSRNRLVVLNSTLPDVLVNLNVSYNSIEALPEALPVGLQTLDACYNKLRRLPQRLPSALRMLDVSHNQLQALPETLPATLQILQVSHNQLHALNPQLLVSMLHLELFDASHNALTTIEDLWVPHQLPLLNVSHNALQNIHLLGPGTVLLIDASYNRIESWKVQANNLTLVGNPRAPVGLVWNRAEDAALHIDLGDSMRLDCDPCSSGNEAALHLRRWMIRQQNNASSGGSRVVRPTQPVCTDSQEQAGRPLVDIDNLENSTDCPWSARFVVQFALLLISVLTVLVLMAAVCYFRRYEITYVMHLVKMRREREAAQRRRPCSYKYDAFICYSSADRVWVVGQLLPTLEHKGDSANERALRLCLHERDFPLGSFIADNIIASMKNSRSTVVILSQAFVDSQWCRWELELASCKVQHLVLLEMHRLERGRLPRHLRYLMDTRTYLEWPAQARSQPAMWKRLRAALTAPAPYTIPVEADHDNHEHKNGGVETAEA